jgi:hypothetical protein
MTKINGLSARLKSCPVTKHSKSDFFSGLSLTDVLRFSQSGGLDSGVVQFEVLYQVIADHHCPSPHAALIALAKK